GEIMISVRRKIAILVTAAIAIVAVAADYGTTARKAARFFAEREWASAGAMYELMLNERPTDVKTYASAIVAAYENADTVKAMQLFTRAQSNLIPFDSILTATRNASFSIGEPRLYEDFLCRTKDANPTLERVVDNYLLKYYLFRRDGEKIHDYAMKMSEGAPNRNDYYLASIKGRLRKGEISPATIEAFCADDHNPDDFESLVYLGVIAMQLAEDSPDRYDEFRSIALSALTAASGIKSTPKLREYISILSGK
ncbi:MAG: hypothetical protein J5784_00270, partial [Muribaculaceae bacterium]|nr:hypothetical protein [Muribaculaceae bacterium]